MFDLNVQLDDKEKCNGLVFKCYDNLYFSSRNSVEYKKSIKLMRSLSCSKCKKCLSELALIEEAINEGWLKGIDELEDGKLYRPKFFISRGYYDSYDEIDYIEFVEIKK